MNKIMLEQLRKRVKRREKQPSKLIGVWRSLKDLTKNFLDETADCCLSKTCIA